jgi:hypothetical protein
MTHGQRAAHIHNPARAHRQLRLGSIGVAQQDVLIDQQRGRGLRLVFNAAHQDAAAGRCRAGDVVYQYAAPDVCAAAAGNDQSTGMAAAQLKILSNTPTARVGQVARVIAAAAADADPRERFNRAPRRARIEVRRKGRAADAHAAALHAHPAAEIEEARIGFAHKQAARRPLAADEGVEGAYSADAQLRLAGVQCAAEEPNKPGIGAVDCDARADARRQLGGHLGAVEQEGLDAVTDLSVDADDGGELGQEVDRTVVVDQATTQRLELRVWRQRDHVEPNGGPRRRRGGQQAEQ